ncbi:juvenile hormone esterase-like [Aedes albopictus]|uniref:Carboxylic ester hydrolase n=1 Tax=Aedes albopictus TaxID=7160 RepID=A0ABM2A6U0_AEDAL|nr:venom carboxylesterase-6-like [Aedes albopictus]
MVILRFFLLIGSCVIVSVLSELSAPRVCIDDGCLKGKFFTSQKGNEYEAFLGVPYAKPPVGDLRFMNPQPVEPWTGDYDASFERSKCVQKNDLWINQKVEGDEDCLYINLYKPKQAKRDKLAVMVYIHGGGYFAGSASKGEFGPDRFMDTEEVILVVLQYRLGVFGFLSTGDQAATGNFGLKDQNAVLRWVKKNIDRFGGNPELVTLFGQSAGGASVQMQMMSPLSKGLIARAWSLSGSALGFWTKPNENPLKFAREQAVAVGIDSVEEMSSEELVEALRQVDAEVLGQSIDKLKFWHVFPLTPYRPVVEQYVDNETFISEDQRDLWARGEYLQVPWVTSFVPNEGAFASVALIVNQTLLDQLNANIESYLPRMLGCPENEKSAQLLKERFFSDGSEDSWITPANAHRIQDILSEAFITFPIAQGVQQHLALDNPSKAPIDVRYFNFSGRYSHSKYFAKNDGNFGVCHSDDLIYLFRAGELFPDFELDSDEYAMAEKLVEDYIHFGYDGLKSTGCQGSTCSILEYDNSKDSAKPYKLSNIEGFDENMIKFWTEFYTC